MDEGADDEEQNTDGYPGQSNGSQRDGIVKVGKSFVVDSEKAVICTQHIYQTHDSRRYDGKASAVSQFTIFFFSYDDIVEHQDNTGGITAIQQGTDEFNDISQTHAGHQGADDDGDQCDSFIGNL